MNYRQARVLLGTNASSTYTQIKQAFRAKAMTTHPDRNRHPNACAQFARLLDAYNLLMNHRTCFQRERYKVKNGRGGFQAGQCTAIASK